MKEALPLIIAGATAVGKSAIALEVAQLLRGEIISVDSMQVYRGLDIGTAKATLKERELIPHHLIDIRDLTQSFDAAAFWREAELARGGIVQRDRVPIFCGGTGLYFKAWLEGLGAAPSGNADLRAELDRLSLAVLLEELQVRDPAMFGSIDRQNKRRVVRAIEVIRLTGQPFSEQRANWNRETRPFFGIGLERTTTDLRERIDRRVESMFQEGLVQEVRRVLPALRGNATAAQAIGYRQVIEHFDGSLDLGATVEAVKIKSRQFSKRQRTWFKRQMQLEWISLTEDAEVSRVAQQIAQLYRQRSVEES